MGRQARKRFTVNGREYGVDMMNPLETFQYGLDCAGVLAPVLASLAAAVQQKAGPESVLRIFATGGIDTRKLGALAGVAWQYVILPDNTLAKDALRVQTWFSEHPEDMYPVAALAVWKLVEDFFPALKATPESSAGSSAPKA